ncbi:MAG: hypothetical protein K0S97_1849 [Chloroflexota bacterium]|jgi:hypothetical protein|nr:hypothetical protein [Chloroflexota bacterium]
MDGRTVDTYFARMRPLVLGLAIAFAAGIGVVAVVELTKPETAGWSDPGAHVVDGLWLGTGTACSLAGGDECSLALGAALERLAVIEPEATVTSASVATPVGAYRNGRGGTILATTAGWVTYNIVVLELADGERLMIGVHCEPRMDSEAGPTPARCQPDAAPVDAPRVGQEPWLQGD